MSEVNYPVQPFVFEFAKEASKKINFSDITIKVPPQPDMSSVQKYLEINNSFLTEYSQYMKPPAPEINTAENCKIWPIFFDPDFDLRQKRIFNKVFQKGCLKQRIFSEQLLLQLDAVQNVLFHSSDNHAFEFFQSFTTIHDMHAELSVLLPRVKSMRSELKQLDIVAQSPEQISTLHTKSERLHKIQGMLVSMRKITSAKPAALAFADSGRYKEAFDLIDEMLKELSGELLGINVMKPYLGILRDTKELIGKKLVDAFKGLFDNDTKQASELIKVLHEQKLIDYAITETSEFIKENSAKQVNKLITDSVGQAGDEPVDLNSLSLHDFSEVLQRAFPIIRTRILAKGANTISTICAELERHDEPTDDANELLQTLCDSVYREVTDILNRHPLNDVTLDDFAQIFDSVTSFGRGFDQCHIDDTLLRTSISTFGHSFIESYHNTLMEILKQALDSDTWVKADPNEKQLEILRKLTNGKTLDGLFIGDERFGCTSSLLTMIELSMMYFQAARRISNTSVDICGKFCEAVQYYNSKTLDLILKGQAFTKKILKNITTKNLALSIANIEFLIKLVPLIQIRFVAISNAVERNNFNTKQTLDALKKHDTELINKVVEVLNKAISGHMDNPVVDDNSVSQYVEKVAKEVNTLNGFVVEYLPEKTVEKIMVSIANIIAERFDRLIRMHDKDKITRDVEKLSQLLDSTKCKIKVKSLPK
jgi:hypothetical protein